MLKKDGKPTTFGPGYFKRTPEKSGLGPEWDQILEDRRNAYRTAAQLQEINRRRQAEEIKKAAGSPMQNLLSAGGGILANALLNRGGNWLSDSLFGSSDPVTASTGGQGLLSSLFGGGGSTAATTSSVTGGSPYTFGLDDAITNLGGSSIMPESKGMLSSLFGGGGSAVGASPASAGSFLPSLGTVGAVAAPVAGFFGLRDLFTNDRGKDRGALQGAASGAAMGAPLGPWGIAGGAALGGLSGFLNPTWNPDRWDTERKRLKDLKDKGINVPQSLIDNAPTRGRSVEELLNNRYANDFIGTGNNNEWVNNKFAQSRDVKDLRPEDVLNYSAFAEKTPNWFDASLEQRKQIAKFALDNGLIDEGRGTIELGQSPEYDAYVKQILGI